jgi:flagellar biosynthesis/type III secretory pathway protein FliH
MSNYIEDLVKDIKSVLISQGYIVDGAEFSVKEYKLLNKIGEVISDSRLVAMVDRDEKIDDDAMEEEYQRGYDEGYEAGQDDAGGEYDNGFNAGFDEGHEAGYNEGYQAGIDQTGVEEDDV